MAARVTRINAQPFRRGATIAAAAVLGMSAVASAQTPSNPFLRVHAVSGSLDGWLNIPVSSATVLPNGYSFSLAGTTPILDTLTSQPIASVVNLTSSITLLVSGVQTLSLSFVVTAGNADTVFSFQSTLSSFLPIFPAEGRATASLGMTDNNGNGGSLIYGQPGGFAYLAEVNGIGAGAPDFTNLLNNAGTGTAAVGPGGSYTDPGPLAYPAAPGAFAGIVPPVSSMHAQYDFTLSANDNANGSSAFFVRPVPAPGAVALLGLGAVIGFRRRR